MQAGMYWIVQTLGLWFALWVEFVGSGLELGVVSRIGFIISVQLGFQQMSVVSS